MAGGYECERDGCTRAVNWLLTRISPAGTISSCDDDAAPFMIGLLATELGVDGGRLYDAIKRFVDKEATKAAKVAADAYDAAQAAEQQARTSDEVTIRPTTGVDRHDPEDDEDRLAVDRRADA